MPSLIVDSSVVSRIERATRGSYSQRSETVKDSSMLSSKVEVRDCFVPLHTIDADGGSLRLNSGIPTGFMVPWCWAAQEMLPALTPASQQRDVWGSSHLKTRLSVAPCAAWDLPVAELGNFDGEGLFNGPGKNTHVCNTSTLAKVRDTAFATHHVAGDLRWFGSELLAARKTILTDGQAEAFAVLEESAVAAAATVESVGISAPDGMLARWSGAGPREIAAILVGGGLLLKDMSDVLLALHQRRLTRVRDTATTLGVTVSDAQLKAWIGGPSLVDVVVPLPLVEFVQAGKVVFSTLQKSPLNQFPEGDHREWATRLGCIRSVLSMPAPTATSSSPPTAGSKRPRESESDGDEVGEGQKVSTVALAISTASPLHASQAAAMASSYVDVVDVDVTGTGSGGSLESPVTVGRIVRGINETINNPAHIDATISFLRLVALHALGKGKEDDAPIADDARSPFRVAIALSVQTTTATNCDLLAKQLAAVAVVSRNHERVGKETSVPDSGALIATIPAFRFVHLMGATSLQERAHVREALDRVVSADVYIPGGKRMVLTSVVGTMAEAIFQVSLTRDAKNAVVVVDVGTPVEGHAKVDLSNVLIYL